MCQLSSPASGHSEMDMGFTSERFPVSTHMCYIYNDDAERRDVMAQFMNSGLNGKECVGYFADISAHQSVEDYLRELGIDVPSHLPVYQALFCHAQDIYCPHQQFSPTQMLNRLRSLYDEVHTHHVQKIRVTGEMTWALSPQVQGTEYLVEYEARLNLLEETHPLTAICQYDATRFDGALLFEILKVHPLMVVRGQIVHNPYYIPVREYLTSRGLPLEVG